MSMIEHILKRESIAGLAVLISLAGLPCVVEAGSREVLVGPHPWDFPDRNRDAAFAYQLSRDRENGGLAGAAGVAAANGLPLVVNSTSMAVGNWQQIEMTLGDGAEGLIMTENHQDNSGNAMAVSDVLNETTQAFTAGEAMTPTIPDGHYSGGSVSQDYRQGDDRHASHGEREGTPFWKSGRESDGSFDWQVRHGR